ncbi:MAG: GNAT family N-acetyltransferase [Bacteroidota bacterium]
MRIIKYGVTLRRIEESDIELVRTWRNKDEIRKNMLFQEYITPEMQKKWFDSINNFSHSYYIIEYNNEKIGLINEKNIDTENNTVESGLFLFGEKHYGSFIPVIASIILIEIGYYLFEGNIGYIHVRKDNKKAIEYNETIGYYILEEMEEFYIMAITKQSFESKTVKLRNAIKNLYGDQNTQFILDQVDFENGVAEACLNILNSLEEDKIKYKDIKYNYLNVLLDF